MVCKQVLWCSLEYNGNLRHATTQTLASTEIERNSSPTAGSDVQAHSSIGLGHRLRIHALFVQEADNFFAALPAAGILTTSRCFGQIFWQTHSSKDLFLLCTKIFSLERNGLFHSGQSKKLKEVVLNNVTGSTDAVVVTGTATHTNVFSHGDLDVVHVLCVPQGLKKLVCKAQRQDVLNCLFTEIVVNAED